MEIGDTVTSMEFTFTDADFQRLGGMVTSYSGIEMGENKRNLMYSRLARRIRTLGLTSFQDYIQHLEKEQKLGSDDELMMMINSMTTNVTHFFREQHHFNHLAAHLDAAVKKNNGRARIWCCASSIGAEPWSIAMTVKQYMDMHPTADIKLMATDIDTQVLTRAQEGEYELGDDEFKKHPILKKYMKSIKADDENFMGLKKYRIDDCLRSLVNFQKVNLINKFPLFLEQQYDFIFCRNVIIYFSKETQQDLFKRIANYAPKGSYLYLGHSENLMGVNEDFHPIGQTTYERK